MQTRRKPTTARFSLPGSGANNFMVRGSVLGSGQAAGRLVAPSDVSLTNETQASFSLIGERGERGTPQGMRLQQKCLWLWRT